MDDTTRRYDASSPSYDARYRDLQMEKYAFALPSPGDVRGPVLDVGCGTGLLGEYLTATVCGIDPSAGMLSYARGRVIPVIGDACALPFPDDTFPLTVSFTVLQNIADYETALNEMARVTHKDGRIVISYLSKSQFSPIGDAIARIFSVEESSPHSEDVFFSCRLR